MRTVDSPTRLPYETRETHRSVSEAPDFKPAQILEVELTQSLPAISAFDVKTDRCYQRAVSLVRLHTQPLGVVELRLEENGLSAADYARQIWRALSLEITEHLRQDELPEVVKLQAAGLPTTGTPKCGQERERLLADAPFVTVVIATRDRPASIATCLRSLLASDYPDYEIIVVDNAPRTSATADWIRQTYGNLRQVRYVREDRPGNSWARNCGLMEARTEIVAFIDDDVLVDAHWLAELAKDFSISENVACVTGMILPVELETPAQAWIEQYGGFSKGYHRRIFDMAENRPDGPLYPYTAGMFGSGANMAFKTSVLREMGGFDPALGGGSSAFGGEDLAVFFQVVTRGYQLVYEPAAIVHHLHHRDYARLCRQMYGYGVGLTAYLTKCLFDNPKRVFEFAAKIPHGLYFTLSSQSSKNKKKLADYPQELTNLERKGMLYGPLAYIRSRHRVHQTRQPG